MENSSAMKEWIGMEGFEDKILSPLKLENMNELKLALNDASPSSVVTFMRALTDENKVVIYGMLKQVLADEVFDKFSSSEQRRLALFLMK